MGQLRERREQVGGGKKKLSTGSGVAVRVVTDELLQT